jgi:SAM-dependent methyltransferase
MLKDHYDELESLDLSYWWFKVRYRYVWRLLRRLAGGPPDFLMDAGAGACGFLASVLAWEGLPAERVLGLEASAQAAAVGRGRGVPVLEADLSRIGSLALPTRPDAITMLDVLEHLDDPVTVLREARRLCRPGGHLVILVPALQMLWSRWDELLGHHRRYDRPLLREQLRASGWELVSLRYLFAPMVLPALVRERLTARRTLAATQFQRVPPLLDRALTTAFTLETYLPGLPFGTTLAAAARRPESDG